MIVPPFSIIRDADGVITPGTSAFEEEALATWRKWQEKRGKEFYVVGPLLPIDDGTKASEKLVKDNEKAASDKGAEIEEFLEKALRENGEHSLVYVSQGYCLRIYSLY